MRLFWLRAGPIAALLLTALAIGHAQSVSACLTSATFCDPCCKMSTGHAPCERGCTASTDCITSAQCACAQPAHVAQVSLLDSRDHSPQAPPLAWVTSPFTTHLIPSPHGPPSTTLCVPLGRYTYLATLRLRI